MEQYINKSNLVAEIKRLIRKNELYLDDNVLDTVRFQKTGAYSVLNEVLHFIDTLEVKEVDDELQGTEKEVAEGFVERINKKRAPISLKGEMKAKFKNEFNTMWQVIDGLEFAKVAKHIVERLCLEFATWGAYNLKGIGEIKNSETLEVKEPDFEKEFSRIWFDFGEYFNNSAVNFARIRTICKHFFELGLKAKGE